MKIARLTVLVPLDPAYPSKPGQLPLGDALRFAIGEGLSWKDFLLDGTTQGVEITVTIEEQV